MTSVKLIVAYPQPTDVEAFEKVYQQVHVPMAGHHDCVRRYLHVLISTQLIERSRSEMPRSRPQ
jgi:hypothetical protein